jgi:hypothetical protein
MHHKPLSSQGSTNQISGGFLALPPALARSFLKNTSISQSIVFLYCALLYVLLVFAIAARAHLDSIEISLIQDRLRITQDFANETPDLSRSEQILVTTMSAIVFGLPLIRWLIALAAEAIKRLAEIEPGSATAGPSTPDPRRSFPESVSYSNMMSALGTSGFDSLRV